MKQPMPALATFEYVQPETIPQAVNLLVERPEAQLMMGGTDLLVRMRNGELHPRTLIDVKSIRRLGDITWKEGEGLLVGAAVSMNALAAHPAVREHYPVLYQALESVASYPLRNRATLGGNLCNASPAADCAPAALIHGAEMIACGPMGERRIQAAAFFRGPGRTELHQTEMLTAIFFPYPRQPGCGHYAKMGRNKAGDLALVSVGALSWPDPATASGRRYAIALGAVAPTPVRIYEAEILLAQQPFHSGTIRQAARIAMQAAEPISDVRASAEYRRRMVAVLTQRSLLAVSMNQEGHGHE